MSKKQKAQVDETAVYITAERPEIEKFHAAGIREIAIRNDREYVFRASEVSAQQIKGENDAEDR